MKQFIVLYSYQTKCMEFHDNIVEEFDSLTDAEIFLNQREKKVCITESWICRVVKEYE